MSNFELFEAIFSIVAAIIGIPLIIRWVVYKYDSKKFSKKAILFMMVSTVLLTVNLYWGVTQLL
jgi:hypothetical protein